MVLLEAELVAARLDAQTATEARLLQMAISAIPNMGVKPASTAASAKQFARVTKMMLGK